MNAASSELRKLNYEFARDLLVINTIHIKIIARVNNIAPKLSAN